MSQCKMMQRGIEPKQSKINAIPISSFRVDASPHQPESAVVRRCLPP
jgi:predicted transposase YdaD